MSDLLLILSRGRFSNERLQTRGTGQQGALDSKVLGKESDWDIRDNLQCLMKRVLWDELAVGRTRH